LLVLPLELLLLTLKLAGQLALIMSTLLTVIVPFGVEVETPLLLLLLCEPAAMLDWSCDVELVPAVPLVAEPLTPPVPALALADGAEPLCGNELELLLAVVSLLLEVLPTLPVALPDGVEALAVVDGELELLLEPISLELELRPAVVLSSMPCTFT
jgi:hypothetical protein